MIVVITYDVNTETGLGQARLRKIAKVCKNYGQRVQNSVFECMVDTTQLKQLQIKLEKIMDQKTDSIRYYNLGNAWKEHVRHVGAKPSLDMDDFLIA